MLIATIFDRACYSVHSSTLLRRFFCFFSRPSSSTTLAKVPSPLSQLTQSAPFSLVLTFLLPPYLCLPKDTPFPDYSLCADLRRTASQQGILLDQLVQPLVKVSRETVFAGTATVRGAGTGGTFPFAAGSAFAAQRKVKRPNRTIPAHRKFESRARPSSISDLLSQAPLCRICWATSTPVDFAHETIEQCVL